MKRPFFWITASAVTLALCVLSYAVTDIQVALFFHELRNTVFYTVFSIVTCFGESQWYLVLGLLLFVMFRSKTKTVLAAKGLFLFTAVATSGVCADIIKYLAGRARPTLYFSRQLYGFDFFHWEPSWTSFPSGHSATAFSVAIVLATWYPQWRFILIFTACLIAFSRIFLAKHYISDVIAGSFLGIVSTVLLYNVYFKQAVDTSESREI
ncbi:MAG: phosphatase PAP2 family protein [Chlorobiaceae bacterium]